MTISLSLTLEILNVASGARLLCSHQLSGPGYLYSSLSVSRFIFVLVHLLV